MNTALFVPLLITILSGAQAPAPVSRDASLSGLPRHALSDLGRLATRTPALALVVGGSAAVGAHRVDGQAARAITRSGAVDEALDGGSVAGGGWIQGGGALAVYAIGRITGNAGTERLGGELIEAQLVGAVLTQGLKLSIRRIRPDGGRFSFPSGHAAATFVTADVLEQHFGWKAGVPAYIGAAYVAASRMAERRHYLSDVVFGAAVGIAASRTLSIHTRQTRLAIFPVLTPGGAAVMISPNRLR